MPFVARTDRLRAWVIAAAIGVSGFLLGNWSGRADAPPSAANDSREQYSTLAASCSERRLELNRLTALLASPDSEASTASEPLCATSQFVQDGAPPPSAADYRNPLSERFYPAGPAELARLARSCSVRVDHPALLDSTPEPVGAEADGMNATPDEVRAMNLAIVALHGSFRERLRALYDEAIGHAPDLELSPRALLGEIRDKAPEAPAQLYRQIAQERAGHWPAPQDLRDASPYERAERMYVGLGDEFQAALARELGAQRASDLRASGGGWTWSRSIFSGCK